MKPHSLVRLHLLWRGDEVHEAEVRYLGAGREFARDVAAQIVDLDLAARWAVARRNARTHLDPKIRLLHELPFEHPIHRLVSLEPSAGQRPGLKGLVGVLEDEHSPLIVEYHAQDPDQEPGVEQLEEQELESGESGEQRPDTEENDLDEPYDTRLH